MIISIIIPALNERSHIEQLIGSINQTDSIERQIIIVDGGSNDGTDVLVHELSVTDAKLTLVRNPARFVSQGFNKAFLESRGTFISLVGAHAQYPPHYFSKCVEAIETGECDAAGGFLVQRGKSKMGQAIAQAMSSQFGVGDTPFRTTRKRMYVDSVAFAVYDRQVFQKVGLLDEELIRNQDDEFHYRLNHAGFRILMLPELEVLYYVIDYLFKLFSQYFQYGFYKPLVFRKVSSGMKLRHLVPSFFVIYLLSLPIAFIATIWLVPLFVYILGALFFSIKSLASWSVRLRMPFVFPVLHIAYGTGFLIGLVRFSKWLKPTLTKPPSI